MSDELRKANADVIAAMLSEELASFGPYLGVKIADTFDPPQMACGHPKSLLIKSTESDYQFCELCEMRSERDDAVSSEEHSAARVRTLTAALEATTRAMHTLIHEGIDRGKGHWPAWDELARAVDGARAALRDGPRSASEPGNAREVEQ